MVMLGFAVSAWKRARKSSFVRGLATLTTAALLQNLITVASAPVTARLFAPAEFGIAGLIGALEVVPVLLATGFYYMALGIARSRSEAINVVALSLLLVPLCAAAVLPLALYLAAHPDLLTGTMTGVAPYLWTIPALMIAINLLVVMRQWEIRHGRYGPQIVNRLIEGGGIAGAQIGLGLVGIGPLGLILGRGLGMAAAGLHGLRLVLAQIGRPGLRAINLRRLRAMAVRHWRFPAFQLPAWLFGQLSQQLTPILLGMLYTLDAVGFYWFASRLLERPGIILGANVARVYYQHAADQLRDGRPVAGLFWRTTGALTAISVIPFGLVILLGPELFALVFGTDWERAGHYARWIALASFAYLIGFPARTATALFGIQMSYAVIETVRAVLGALVVILIACNDGDALLAVAAATFTQSLIMLAFVGFIGICLLQRDRRQRPT